MAYSLLSKRNVTKAEVGIEWWRKPASFLMNMEMMKEEEQQEEEEEEVYINRNEGLLFVSGKLEVRNESILKVQFPAPLLFSCFTVYCIAVNSVATHKLYQ